MYSLIQPGDKFQRSIVCQALTSGRRLHAPLIPKVSFRVAYRYTSCVRCDFFHQCDLRLRHALRNATLRERSNCTLTLMSSDSPSPLPSRPGPLMRLQSLHPPSLCSFQLLSLALRSPRYFTSLRRIGGHNDTLNLAWFNDRTKIANENSWLANRV